jgi:uncharacterized protein YkwD
MSKLFIILILCFLFVGCRRQDDEGFPDTMDYESTEYLDNELLEGHSMEEYADFEQRVFERINTERISHGLAPLLWSDALVDVARSHSRDMAQSGFFDFISQEGFSSSDRITNAGIPWLNTQSFIMRGNRLTPESISLPDEDTLLNEVLTHIGIGFYRSTESQYERYLTFEFIFMPTRPSDEMINEWERLVLDLTNEYRSSYGLPMLVWDDRLAHAAQLHSADMAYNNFIGHDGSDGSNIGERITRAGWEWRIVKENVAVGQYTPYIVLDGWINSPGHRSNMLSDDITYLGVGFYFLEGSQFFYHWTQKFGTPLS